MKIIDACEIPISEFQINIMLKVVKQSMPVDIYKQLTPDLLAGATLYSMLTIGLISRKSDLTELGKSLVNDFEQNGQALIASLNTQQLTEKIAKHYQ